MRARRLTLSTFIAAITLGLLTLATPAVAAGPAPAAGQPEAYILIDEGLVIFDPALAVVSLRYACYGDPTTMDVTATVGGVQASGSVSIPCQGVLELGTQVQLRVPEKAPQFPPGTYDVAVHASIPGQATLDRVVNVEGPAPSSAVFLDSFVSPTEVAKGRKITITGNVRTGGFEAPTALKLALEFRPDGGAWGKLKTVRSDADGRVETKVRARTSGNFRLRFAGSATLDPATSYPNYVLVRPKPKKYKSCTALNKVYKHGVGRSGATEVGLGVKSWTRITPTYDKNSKLDLDKDGVACEKV
ncbi:excalibur calcium-binding domain-containing protein [Microlunatus flavus]|uniref:Excalibur calcium-binding domain-containing protein n=1 Tax=Microlunatus flavus TaxID=1036181 RepID=A0A1H9J300_9ACTN|nr:excalibur calcium-binding domain-containing protein [Microlunatus flavus]SEQ81156.1 Excalibur calcium-binding domain-containing protein [Microlunatus flavus]